MPELRLIVLALQDRLAYGTNFDAALAALLGQPLPQPTPSPAARPQTAAPPPAADLSALIRDAARDLADYQRLTAEGKLGEAGQRLESLKEKLAELQRRQR
jgi:uncharacterized membrane protein (UPF0182 family)